MNGRSAELSSEQLAALRRHLEQLAVALRGMVETSADGAAPVDLDEPIGRLSRMEAISQAKMTTANRAAAQRRLTMATAALARLDHDPAGFGQCIMCDEPIGFARLSARPETVTCLACQTSRERG